MVFDKDMKTFRPIKPTDYISKTTGYLFQPSNAAIKSKVKDIIEDIFMLDANDEEGRKLAKYYLTIKAHSLFGNKLEKVYILVGSGRNGKSLIIETLEKKALGSYSYTAENTFITSQFRQGAPNPTLYECKGVRNLIISEPSENDEFQREVKINKPFLKQVSGNDSVTTRTLHKGNITYKPLFTLFLLCNQTPAIDLDKATMKRLQVIPCRNTYSDTPNNTPGSKKIDYSLKDLFNREDYACQYLHLLFETYLANQDEHKIAIPSLVSGSTTEYFDDNDLVCKFISEHLKVNPNASIKASDMYSYFKQFCVDNHEANWNPKKFSNNMAMNNILVKKTKQCNMYFGYEYVMEQEEEPTQATELDF